MNPRFALALATLAALPTLAAAPPTTAELPVREIALFSSGVGYFQHEGPVRDNATAQFQFKTAQINDLLKSLVLQDLGGGTIGTVTYPSQDPIEKTLRSFQVDITGNPPLADLLNQLRGAKILLSTAADKLQGTVLGVELRDVPAGGEAKQPIRAAFLNLISAAGIRSIPLADVRSLQFEDPALQAELDKALAALSAARGKDKKTVGVQFNGKGERAVRLGYTVETPVWKTSYRLVFGSKPEDKPHLQGWALVENQTENDWNDVKLSLVSGRPISFIQDLYRPLYVQRPVVQSETQASIRPQTYDEGVAGAPMPASEPSAVAGVAGGAARNQPASKAKMARAPAEGLRQLPSFAGATATENDSNGGPLDPSASIAAAASAGAVGELFQYTVAGVTLPRQRSAMIPIVNDTIDAEKISIFNEGVLAKFPLYGARLKNTAPGALHLLGGPVTIYADGRYAGDARISDLPPKQTRLLSYGIDLQLPVLVEGVKDNQRVQSGKIVGGVLQLARKYVSSRTYVAENKSDRTKKLVVEQPRRSKDSKVVDSPAPLETTETLWRFQVEIAAGKTEKLTINEEQVTSESLALLGTTGETVLGYLREGSFAPAVKEALTKAATMQQAIAETGRQTEGREEQLTAITEEQGRIRENLKTADKGTYKDRLSRKLDDQETQIEKLQGEMNALRKRHELQQREFEEYLKALNVG